MGHKIKPCLWMDERIEEAVNFYVSVFKDSKVHDVSRYPEDVQAAYKVFAVRCSRCHTLARPLNARIRDPQHWVRYVQRMRLNSASGINAKNGEIILHFLLYYMQQREAERRAKNPDADAEDMLAPESSSSIGPDEEPAPDAVEPQPPAATEPAPAPSAGEALSPEMSL